MADPALLDLTIERSRPHVLIDGAAYDLRTTSDLTLLAYTRIQRLGPEIGRLVTKGSEAALTEAEDRQLSGWLDELCRLVLIAPDALHATLGDVHRTLITEAFMRLLPQGFRGVGVTVGGKRTGPKSSRGSRGSTGARRSTGSPVSPSASSGLIS